MLKCILLLFVFQGYLGRVRFCLRWCSPHATWTFSPPSSPSTTPSWRWIWTDWSSSFHMFSCSQYSCNRKLVGKLMGKQLKANQNLRIGMCVNSTSLKNKRDLSWRRKIYDAIVVRFFLLLMSLKHNLVKLFWRFELYVHDYCIVFLKT